MCELAGVAAVKVSSIPNTVLRLGRLFVPGLRELREVSYQFEAPFVIDSRETTDTFGLEPTPTATTLQATLDSYQALVDA